MATDASEHDAYLESWREKLDRTWDHEAVKNLLEMAANLNISNKALTSALHHEAAEHKALKAECNNLRKLNAALRSDRTTRNELVKSQKARIQLLEEKLKDDGGHVDTLVSSTTETKSATTTTTSAKVSKNANGPKGIVKRK